MLGKIKTICQY